MPAHECCNRLSKQLSLRTRDEQPHEDLDGARPLRLTPNSSGKPLSESRLWTVAQLVNLGDSVHAPDGAERRAGFDLVVFPSQVGGAIALQGNCRMTALLRAPVHQAVLADVEIPGAGAAMPLVGPTEGEILLKAVVVCEGERRLPKANRLFKYRMLHLVKKAQTTGPIVNDADGCREPELVGAVCDRQRVGWLTDPTADDRVDGHVELGVGGEPPQLLIE